MPKPSVKYHPPNRIMPNARTMAIIPLTIRDQGISGAFFPKGPYPMSVTPGLQTLIPSDEYGLTCLEDQGCKPISPQLLSLDLEGWGMGDRIGPQLGDTDA